MVLPFSYTLQNIIIFTKSINFRISSQRQMSKINYLCSKSHTKNKIINKNQSFLNSEFFYISILDDQPMINPLFLPQNSKKKQQTPAQANKEIRRQFKLIHQLDCIYQGEVNASYQREGFGVQQTNDFNMYLGFWKSNKPNGIGMIIYPEGGIIYGNFKDNQLYGVAITDNKKKLRVGVHQNCQIIGVGYEYVYEQTIWKLCRFHKGVCIQTISSTVLPLQKGIPSIFNLHQDMYMLLSKYLNEQFFDIPHKNIMSRPYRPYTQMNVHKINNSYLFFGQIIQGKYWGLGMIYDKQNGHAIQTGFYQMGEMNGYGLKLDRDKDKNKIEIGLYSKGKKQGFFYEKTNHIETISQYQKNYMKGDHPQLDRSKIKNNQKIFNYQKNDFYSQRNKIKFLDYNHLLKNDQKKITRLNQTLKKNLGGVKNSEKKSANKNNQKSPSKLGDKNHPKSPKYMMAESVVQKSTVQAIRQKLGDIDRIIKRSKVIVKEQKSPKSPKSTRLPDTQKSPNKGPNFLALDENQNQKQMISDGQIDTQYEPVSKQKNRLNFSQNSRYQGRMQPNEQLTPTRKIWSPEKTSTNKYSNLKSNQRVFTGQKLQSDNHMFTSNISPNKSSQLLTNRSPSANGRSISARKKRRIFQ